MGWLRAEAEIRYDEVGLDSSIPLQSSGLRRQPGKRGENVMGS